MINEATFKLRTSGSNNKVTVQLQLNLPGRERLVFTVGSIEAKEWNSKKRKSKSNGSFNNYMDHLKAVADKANLDYPTIDQGSISRKKYIHDALKKAAGITDPKPLATTFFQFLEIIKQEKIDQLRRPNTIEKYTALKTVLTGYSKNQNTTEVHFEEINAFEWKNSFMQYCYNVRGMKGNTLSKYLKMIREIVNEAFDRGLHSNSLKNSKKFKGDTIEADKIFLNVDELNSWYNFPDNKLNPVEIKARDLFILQCDTGLRIGDRKRLDELNFKPEGFYLRTEKTSKQIFAPHTDRTIQILKKYNNNLPIIYSQLFNRTLKDIGRKVGIVENIEISNNKKERIVVPKFSKITSHVARRSFVTNALISGINPQSIMAVTGHTTEAELYNYSCITQQEKAKIKNRL
jgi:integrase